MLEVANFVSFRFDFRGIFRFNFLFPFDISFGFRFSSIFCVVVSLPCQ